MERQCLTLVVSQSFSELASKITDARVADDRMPPVPTPWEERPSREIGTPPGGGRGKAGALRILTGDG